MKQADFDLRGVYHHPFVCDPRYLLARPASAVNLQISDGHGQSVTVIYWVI